MTTKKIVFFLVLSITFTLNTNGQHQNSLNHRAKILLKDSLNYSVLIPFSDKGKWGWADTLGNVIIESQFKKTWFFNYETIDNKKIYFAAVSTKTGRNYYIQNIGLAAPKEYEILSHGLGITNVRESSIHFNNIVKDANQKLGVFETINQKMVVTPQYDSLSRFALRQDIVLLKKKEDSTFDYFSLINNSIERSDILHIDYLNIKSKSERYGSCCTTVLKKKDGTAQAIYKGSFKPFEFVDTLEYESELNTFYARDEIPEYAPIKEVPSHGQTNEVLATHDYSRYGAVAKRYGFTILSIVRKDNKVGIINELGEIIVPFIYDKIRFSSNYTQAKLFKNDKQGIKLFFTKYPTIEAKYDSLKEYKSLRVNPTWSFGIFEVKIGDFVGYVGENGVEYFIL